MTRAMRLLVLAVVAAPVMTYVVYRLARGLGFLEPPWNKEHEYRRTIIAAIYAFLLFLPILLLGYANAWPRVWWIFGVVNGLALVGFAAMVPFMNTGLVVGPVANALHGADLSFYVGFLVAGVVYSFRGGTNYKATALISLFIGLGILMSVQAHRKLVMT